MINNNYYEVLGIETHASNEDIKRAYRRLSLIYHPDKHNNDSEKLSRFKMLSEAYQTLSDNILRDKYNRENNIKNTENIGNMGNMGNMGNTPENNNYCSDYGNRGGGNMPNHFYRDQNYHYGDERDMVNCQYSGNSHIYQFGPYSNNGPRFPSNYLSSLHNRFEPQQNVYKPKPIDIIKEIEFTQSYYGDNITIFISREIIVKNEKYNETETFYVDIETGIDNNEIITIKDKGNILNNVSGDVKIKIILVENDIYKRKGLDLLFTKNISFKESVCGFTFILKHINGKSYTINNTTGVIINPNYTTSIPKLGFKKGDNVGSLVINYIIDYPERLSRETINKINTLL